jgi:hypothetical protein
MHLRHIAALTLLLAIGNAMAEDSIHGLQTRQEFAAMKARIVKDIGDGKQYKEMTANDQKTLVAALNRMDARWEHADENGQLNPNDRVEMANDQELVSTITQHASADTRVVCQRIEPIGSHFPKNVCKTVAQARREQEQSQDAMRAGTVESSH